MLPWETKFDRKYLFMVFNEKIFLSGAASLSNLSLKTRVLVGLITKWSIESVAVNTRLAVKI